MKIITWNINSVRLRMPLIAKLTKQEQPDILCLQETKVADELFPTDDIKQLGYEYIEFRGQKSYNGVAILSKTPLSNSQKINFANQDDSRHLAVSLPNGVELHNFYVPAGGDEPDTSINPKYKHKLDFVDHMTSWSKQLGQQKPAIILGDFNIAPGEHDVWSHKQLKNVVSHTEPEITRLNQLKSTLNWVDIGRHFIPEDEKLYSWWSYRNRDWKKSNRGRRLDHIWVTPSLKVSLKSYYSLSEARDWEKPSDHVPVIVNIW